MYAASSEVVVVDERAREQRHKRREIRHDENAPSRFALGQRTRHEASEFADDVARARRNGAASPELGQEMADLKKNELDP